MLRPTRIDPPDPPAPEGQAARDTPRPAAAPPGAAAFKSRPGLSRVWRAGGHSWAGLRAAFTHEAAFRQELALGVPLVAFAWWAAPGRWQAFALTASVLLVWLVEMLNSAIEALADAVSPDPHPLIGRAKDLGSAAVLFALAIATLTWGVVFWP